VSQFSSALESNVGGVVTDKFGEELVWVGAVVVAGVELVAILFVLARGGIHSHQRDEVDDSQFLCARGLSYLICSGVGLGCR